MAVRKVWRLYVVGVFALAIIVIASLVIKSRNVIPDGALARLSESVNVGQISEQVTSDTNAELAELSEVFGDI